MSKPKVFIGQKVAGEVTDYIGNYCDFEMWEEKRPIPREELYKRLKDKVGMMVFGIQIDDELLDNAPLLKVVSNISVGYDNLDLNAMKARGIIGTNTAGALDETVADLIFGLMLSVSRRIAELDRYVKEGKWKHGDGVNLFGTDVHHATLGIIGMGRIGEAVARRARLGFGMEVLYYNRNRKMDSEEKLGVRYSDMENLLSNSDFVLLMTALTRETHHLMDSKQFAMMKNSAFFINASRGQTVNEAALIEALEKRQISGAGLDVYELEPMNPNNPLLTMPNVVTLPHIGSATSKTRTAMAMTAAVNLVKAVNGEAPPNIIPELR